jgi:hypothetical protein
VRLRRFLTVLLLVVSSALASATLAAPQVPAASSNLPRSAKEEIVYFNTKSHKYHCLTCVAAKRCTRNCIDLPVSEAKARGGVPCKICGGSCRL